MTEQEQIDHLRDQIFTLRMTLSGISGSSSSSAIWTDDAQAKADFLKIEKNIDKALDQIKMTPTH